MQDSDLTKLRRARSRVHKQIAQLEPMLADYHAKLADIEARIQEIAPELNLPPRRYSPNPHFARGELPRLAMNIMRAASGPLATREIAVRALAVKGIVLPDRRAMKLTRLRLQQTFCSWQAKGWVVRVGVGKAGKRTLV